MTTIYKHRHYDVVVHNYIFFTYVSIHNVLNSFEYSTMINNIVHEKIVSTLKSGDFVIDNLTLTLNISTYESFTYTILFIRNTINTNQIYIIHNLYNYCVEYDTCNSCIHIVIEQKYSITIGENNNYTKQSLYELFVFVVDALQSKNDKHITYYESGNISKITFVSMRDGRSFQLDISDIDNNESYTLIDNFAQLFAV